jgi:hypothetical protein
VQSTDYNIDLPAHWAPFVFYGDATGMDDDDIAMATREINEHTQDGYVFVEAALDDTWHGPYRRLLCVMAEYTLAQR